MEYFCPQSCTLNDCNSVLLKVAGVTLYFDQVLKNVGLHTEARTSFITYEA